MVISSKSGRWPGSTQPAGDVMRATLTDEWPEFTRPAYSSIFLGMLPAAAMTVGAGINEGIPGFYARYSAAMPTTRRTLSFGLAGMLAAMLAAAPGGQTPATAFPPAIDPQRWQDQDDMTWADYKPIPGTDWGNRSAPVGRALRVALVAIDFED